MTIVFVLGGAFSYLNSLAFLWVKICLIFRDKPINGIPKPNFYQMVVRLALFILDLLNKQSTKMSLSFTGDLSSYFLSI